MDIEKLIKRLRYFGGELGATPLNNVIGQYMLDAADVLFILQVENEKLRNELARVTAKRDAAVSDLELFATCDTCKFGEMKMAYDCLGCDHASNWKWRGQKED